MAKVIKYTAKGKTNSNCDYVVIDNDDMKYLIQTATLMLTLYAELTASDQGLALAGQRDSKLFGKRGRTQIAPNKANTRLSLLGGLISNYMNKQSVFKNDISANQLKYIENAINECASELNIPSINFEASTFGK